MYYSSFFLFPHISFRILNEEFCQAIFIFSPKCLLFGWIGQFSPSVHKSLGWQVFFVLPSTPRKTHSVLASHGSDEKVDVRYLVPWIKINVLVCCCQLFKRKKNSVFFLCVCVIFFLLFQACECFDCTYVRICTTECLVTVEAQKRASDPLELEWRIFSKLPRGCWDLNLGSFQEQPMLLNNVIVLLAIWLQGILVCLF